MVRSSVINEIFEKGTGILRRASVFVPRRFSQAGCRRSLHPHDLKHFGSNHPEMPQEIH